MRTTLPNFFRLRRTNEASLRFQGMTVLEWLSEVDEMKEVVGRVFQVFQVVKLELVVVVEAVFEEVSEEEEEQWERETHSSRRASLHPGSCGKRRPGRCRPQRYTRDRQVPRGGREAWFLSLHSGGRDRPPLKQTHNCDILTLWYSAFSCF